MVFVQVWSQFLQITVGPGQWKWNCMEILPNLGTCLDLEPWGQQQCQLYSRGRPLPIFWRIDFPQNCESGQYRYFLTQHQATSAEWPSNTRPDCGRLTPKVPGVFGQNQSVVQKSGNDCFNQKKNMIVNFTDGFQFHTRLKLNSQSIEVVKQMKVLGTIFTDRLSWNENSDSIVKKGKCKNAIDKKKN